MTPEERRALIQRYEASFEAIQLALFHIGAHGLDSAPDGEWTPRQIAHHLADAELFRSIRLRMLLAEDASQLPALEGTRYAANLNYARPIEASMTLLRAAMAVNIELVRDLPEDAWHRAGDFGKYGRFTVEDWLVSAGIHGFEHAVQLEANAAWHADDVHSKHD